MLPRLPTYTVTRHGRHLIRSGLWPIIVVALVLAGCASARAATRHVQPATRSVGAQRTSWSAPLASNTAGLASATSEPSATPAASVVPGPSFGPEWSEPSDQGLRMGAIVIDCNDAFSYQGTTFDSWCVVAAEVANVAAVPMRIQKLPGLVTTANSGYVMVAGSIFELLDDEGQAIPVELMLVSAGPESSSRVRRGSSGRVPSGLRNTSRTASRAPASP